MEAWKGLQRVPTRLSPERTQPGWVKTGELGSDRWKNLAETGAEARMVWLRGPI